MEAKLLTDIENFLAETGMGEYRFGFLAARNGRLVERLRAARDRDWKTEKGKAVMVRPETVEQVRTFMAERRPDAGRAA